jgi:chromosome segregation ATPase
MEPSMQIDLIAPGRRRAAALAGAFLVLMAAAPAARADADRERAQMLQMQQQLQRLQSDNAAIQRERADLQAKAQDADKLKKAAEQTTKDLARAHQTAAAQARELAGVRAELAATQAQLAAARADGEQLRKTVAERDTALQLAGIEKRRDDQGQALLTARLKLQTGRADLCEQRHAAVMKFSSGVIDRYESERLRLCEPVTGIWKVQAESRIQQMRDELYTYRLDIPAPVAASADGAAAPAIH